MYNDGWFVFALDITEHIIGSLIYFEDISGRWKYLCSSLSNNEANSYMVISCV